MLQFVALLKLHQSSTDFKRLMEIDEEMGGEESVWNVPDGVRLIHSLHCLSQYDLIAFYEAPDGESAEKMFSELESVASIDRILGIPCDICERTHALQKELVKP